MGPIDDGAAEPDPRRLHALARRLYVEQRRSLLTLTAWTAVLYLVPLAALHAHASMAAWRLAALAGLLALSLLLVARRLLLDARAVHGLLTTVTDIAVEAHGDEGDGRAGASDLERRSGERSGLRGAAEE